MLFGLRECLGPRHDAQFVTCTIHHVYRLCANTVIQFKHFLLNQPQPRLGAQQHVDIADFELEEYCMNAHEKLGSKNDATQKIGHAPSRFVCRRQQRTYMWELKIDPQQATHVGMQGRAQFGAFLPVTNWPSMIFFGSVE